MLDWATATITLPLDAYGMSVAEVHIVDSAASIAFARCVTGQHHVSAAVVAEARLALEPSVPDPVATHWLFGVWSASYVAERGWYPFPEDPPHPWLLETDSNTFVVCANSADVSALDAITAHEAPDEYRLVGQLSYDAYLRTLATTEFSDLNDLRAACLSKAGFETYGIGDGGGVVLRDDWSEEQMLKARLAEAQCDDEIGFTQQASDIAAGFQAQAIAEHEAELLAIRQECDARVAKAHEILRSVGIE